jgi:hypothetical protein
MRWIDTRLAEHEAAMSRAVSSIEAFGGRIGN